MAALSLIERDGYEAFSVRKLAAGLGCKAMSIYHYYPSMTHLRDALLDRLVAATPVPPRDLPWIERMRRTCYAYRGMALAYPRFFQVAVLHRMNTAAGLRFLETMLEIFRDAGFDTESAARLFRAVGYYIAGAALDESSGYAKGPSAVQPVPDDVAARDYPLITAVNPWFRQKEHERTFAIGLEIMLDGVRRAHAAMRKASPRSGAKRKVTRPSSGARRARSSRSSSR